MFWYYQWHVKTKTYYAWMLKHRTWRRCFWFSSWNKTKSGLSAMDLLLYWIRKGVSKKACPSYPSYLERGILYKTLTWISWLLCHLVFFFCSAILAHKVQVLGVGELGLQDKNRDKAAICHHRREKSLAKNKYKLLKAHQFRLNSSQDSVSVYCV